jgi:hypothetical protein
MRVVKTEADITKINGDRRSSGMETYHLTSAQDNAIGDYRQVGYMKFENEASRLMQFWLWVFITIVAAFAFFFLARDLGKLPGSFQLGAAEILIGIVVFVATLAIHEGIHVLVMRRYGVRPKFGLTRNKVIATITVPGYGFHRNTVIWMALAPLIVLTALALLGIWLFQGTTWVALFALIGVVNTGAAIADLWMIAILLRYPSNAWTVDDEHGMRILLQLESK